MESFTGLQTLCQDESQDYSSEALTFFESRINTGYHILESELGSFYTEETASVTTTASTDSYKTPANFVRLKKAYITISSIRHYMEEIFSEDEWQHYKASTAGTSNILTKILVRRDNFEVYPTPASSGNTITLIYEAGGKDLTADDYTTGTITTLTNGAKAVTASGTTFTSAMAGRYLKINSDGNWYKIATFGTTTTLTLDKAYEGISIAAGSEAYTIGEMPRTPQDTHQIPAWYALWRYYTGFKQNTEKAAEYKADYRDDLARAKRTYARRYSTKYIPPRTTRLRQPVNPNWYPKTMA